MAHLPLNARHVDFCNIYTKISAKSNAPVFTTELKEPIPANHVTTYALPVPPRNQTPVLLAPLGISFTNSSAINHVRNPPTYLLVTLRIVPAKYAHNAIQHA